MNAQDRADFITQAVMNMIQGQTSLVYTPQVAVNLYQFANLLWEQEKLLRLETEKQIAYEETHCKKCDTILNAINPADPASELYCPLCEPSPVRDSSLSSFSDPNYGKAR